MPSAAFFPSLLMEKTNQHAEVNRTLLASSHDCDTSDYFIPRIMEYLNDQLNEV